MTRTNDELRALWGPKCLPAQDAAEVWYDGRKFLVHPLTVDAWLELFNVMKRWHYSIDDGTLDDWSLVCRKITGGSKLSMHSFGTAIDVNSITNPYGPTLITDMPSGMVAEIKAIRTMNGAPVFRWGGDYRSNKDAMHYEIIASPSELITGIAGQKDEDDMTPEQNTMLENIHHAIGGIQQDLVDLKERVSDLEKDADRNWRDIQFGNRLVTGALVPFAEKNVISPANIPVEIRKYAKAIEGKGEGYAGEGYNSLLQGP
jgi:hypothetical protein